MPLFSSRHGVWIFILACSAGLRLLPAQVNPASLTRSCQAEANRQAAFAEIGVTTLYDPAYVKLDYPGGDVPGDRGVCT